jgi:hypothetical protein
MPALVFVEQSLTANMHNVTFLQFLRAILQCARNFILFTILQFCNFQASLNHRANACSCFFPETIDYDANFPGNYEEQRIRRLYAN